jgi:hypothetical protein
MQLGTRWNWGTEPPARLPSAVVGAIREVEQSAGSPDLRWTLTWLEGRPIVELDPVRGSENVTVIRYNRIEDTASITSDNSGEEWVEE